MDYNGATANYFRMNVFNGVSIAYIDCAESTAQDIKYQGTVMLIHGFPQCSYQWRDVIPILVNAGYRVLAPDYRGAGESSKPIDGFSKANLAADLILLLDRLGINEQVHVVGHDIGGMIAFALASRWPERIASVCISECLLPGTNAYYTQRMENPVDYFHYTFHSVANLPEALIMGRERTYIEYFINRYCYRIGAFLPHHISRYSSSYSQPGAVRCALDLYRAFDKDGEDLLEWMEKNGKCTVPCMVLSGEHSNSREYTLNMTLEVVDQSKLTNSIVPDAGHFLPEENARASADALLAFIQQRRVTGPRR